MKKLNVLQVFMLVFCVAVFSVSCSKDDEGIEIYDETSTELYNRNLNVLKNTKTLTSLIIKQKKYNNDNYIKLTEDFNYYLNKENFKYSLKAKKDNRNYQEKNLTIDVTELNQDYISEKTKYYFLKLNEFYNNKNYDKLLLLLDEYKYDISQNSDESLNILVTPFGTIETYKNSIENFAQNKTSDCGDEVIDGAIGGAISGAFVGAISGGLYGSFLGPLGT